MAAVTITRQRSAVVGSMREKYYQINIAATGDTLAVGGMKRLESVSAIPNNAAAAQVGATVSGATITFQTGGAETAVLVRAVGF